MRKILLTCIFLGLLFSTLKAQTSLRVMTFNIRFNNPGDGENAWPKRIPLVQSMIDYYQPDVLGVQEALPDQVAKLKEILPAYDFYGIPRSASSPEYCGIFYLSHAFELLSDSGKGTFWLAPDPSQESKGWDAALPRISSWVRLKSKESGEAFLFVNTHFDHVGEIARKNSVRVIAEETSALSIMEGDSLPVILLGDFNLAPEAEPIRDLEENYGFKDAFTHSLLPHHGPSSTWSGWRMAGEPGRRIDYIFFKNKVEALTHATLSDSWSGRFPSDHLPVVADLLLNPVHHLLHAHSHNDYEQERPLREALEIGFTSVEADIWAWKGSPLLVSHERPLFRNRLNEKWTQKSLDQLYLKPLAAHILKNRGRVYPGSDRPFYLMIDIKSKNFNLAYKKIKESLEDYSWMLEGENPPVKIILSGQREVETLAEDGGGLLGIDGRPEHLGKGYESEKMPIISQRYGKILNWKGRGDLSANDRKNLKLLVEAVHAEGKKLRLWASPEKEEVWDLLLEMGVDLINTDEVQRLRNYLLEKD